MIFVTVGAQTPFDRLVRAVDAWAGSRQRSDLFAQIGLTGYRPQFLQYTAFMDPPEFRKKLELADLVVTHAGMDSIRAALEMGKPVLVLPRRGDLREAHNDHQAATAKQFLAQGCIVVALDEDDLALKLDQFGQSRAVDGTAGQALAAFPAALREAPADMEQPYAQVVSPLEGPASLGRGLADRFGDGSFDRGPSEPMSARLPAQPAYDRRSYTCADIKARMRAMILLTGRLRFTDLGKRAGRSRLDLPVDRDRTLLGYWRDEGIGLAHAWGVRNLPMRVLLDQASHMPTLPAGRPGVTVSLERDKLEFRGTGGVLRDASAEYDDRDWILVANAAQMLYAPLRQFADSLAEAGGEINVVSDNEGIPNGVILLRCGVLRSVPDIGFHDMKEQVVPSLAKRHSVKVIATEGLTSRPIHALEDFIATLRAYHSRRTSGPDAADCPDERWQSHFSICEPGAVVAPTAVVHDSVILHGAVVEHDAVVVRSVVGPGARVRSGRRVFDEVIA